MVSPSLLYCYYVFEKYVSIIIITRYIYNTEQNRTEH